MGVETLEPVQAVEEPDGYEASEVDLESVDAGPLAVTDDERLLFRYVRRAAQLEAEMVRVKECAAAMMHDLQAKRDGLEFVYGGMAAQIARNMLKGKSRSIKTPFGTAGFRKSAARLVVLDADAIKAAVANGELPEAVVKKVETVNVVKAELDRLHELTSEIPPGCELKPESDTFYVK